MHAAPRLSLAVLGMALVSAAMMAPLDVRWARAQADEDPAGLIDMAAAADRRGDYPAALNALQHALTIEQASGDTTGVPATLVGLGNVYHHVGQYDQALQAYNQARALDTGSGQLLVDIGAVYHDLGQYDQALRAYDAGLVLLRQAGDSLGEAAALSNVGVTYDRQGRNEDALGAYQRALELQRDRDARGPAGITLGNIGLVLDHLKRFGEAQAADNQALSLLREVGDRRAEAIVLANLGLLDEERFRLEQALSGYRAAIQIQEERRRARPIRFTTWWRASVPIRPPRHHHRRRRCALRLWLVGLGGCTPAMRAYGSALAVPWPRRRGCHFLNRRSSGAT